MDLHLTVALRDPRAPAPGPVDVVAEVRPGATAAHLAGELAAYLECEPHARLFVGGTPVPSDHPVGASPLSDGAAVTLLPAGAERPGGWAPAARPLPHAALRLAVVHGPDAGRSVPLAPGVHVVGRSSGADLALEDPNLSRCHAEVRHGESGVRVRDLVSTNGTRLDGHELTGAPSGWVLGQRLELGSTVLELRSSEDVPIASRPGTDGTRAVNRRPRLPVDRATPHITLPRQPAPPIPTRVPWVAVLLPLPVAAVMAVLLGPVMLMFALMGPVVMMGTAVNDRWVGRRRYAAQLRDYEGHLAEARRRVDEARVEELSHLRRSHPDPATVLATARGPGSRLWERRLSDADALVVSLGRCLRAAEVRVAVDGTSAPEVHHLPDAPCTVPLAVAGPLGVAGPQARVTALARSLVGQLAALHPPQDLRFVVLADESSSLERWQWMARLPHLRDASGRLRPGSAAAGQRTVAGVIAALVGRVEAVASLGDRPRNLPHVVVLVDGAAALRGVPGLSLLLERGPAAGVHTIALDRDTGRLPVEVRSVVGLGAPHATATVAGTRHDAVTVDQVGAWWADRLSRSLAPLRDATATAEGRGLPTTVQWSALSPPPPVDADDVVDLWRRQPSCTAVPVGQDDGGTTRLDLVGDGPHFLVAGTTGSGKSELLRTLVTSLAVHNSPAHLSLVLVDYKGGAAFRECADLPHTTGVVTDLDDRLAGRALASLRAELRRRETLLADAGVADFAAYQHSRHQDGPLPRLVLVIDEFRALADELPDFVEGLVRVAALGRSLGIHLVLATQRPAGVVTADIKANVNGRIALRVRDRADSDDVIDSPVAATAEAATPGRAFLRTGGGALRTFQTALVTQQPSVAAARVRVTAVPWGVARAPTEDVGRAGLRGLVDVVAEAARRMGTGRPTPAWLAPLPEHVGSDHLVQPESPFSVAVGLVDQPEAQSQPPLEVDLTAPGHWAFVGSAGSGRTTALLTTCRTVAARLGPTQVHLYAVSDGGLAQLERLPHCGAHVDRSDRERLRRLVGRLGAEVGRRRGLLTSSGFATLVDWHTAGSRARASPPPPPPPALVLAIDDWDLLASPADAVDDLVDDLVRLLREGGPVGVRAVLAGGRGLLHGGIASLVAHRVVLRLSDATDAALAGVPTSWARGDTPPGRGLLMDGHEVQVALPPQPPVVAERHAAGDLPFPVAALPAHVEETELAPASGAVALGVGGDEAKTLALEPARHGRRWLVAGPPGSGVSTTLLVAARQLLAQGLPVAVVPARPGPLDALRHDARLTAWCDLDVAGDLLVTTRRRHPDLRLVVDAADSLQDHPVERVLRDVMARVDTDGGLVVAGACSTALASQFRGFAVDLSRHRTGVLLGGGGPGAGDVFGLRLPRIGAAPPGRALLVTREGTVPFQVAQPGEAAAHGA